MRSWVFCHDKYSPKLWSATCLQENTLSIINLFLTNIRIVGSCHLISCRCSVHTPMIFLKRGDNAVCLPRADSQGWETGKCTSTLNQTQTRTSMQQTLNKFVWNNFLKHFHSVEKWTIKTIDKQITWLSMFALSTINYKEFLLNSCSFPVISQ